VEPHTCHARYVPSGTRSRLQTRCATLSRKHSSGCCPSSCGSLCLLENRFYGWRNTALSSTRLILRHLYPVCPLIGMSAESQMRVVHQAASLLSTGIPLSTCFPETFSSFRLAAHLKGGTETRPENGGSVSRLRLLLSRACRSARSFSASPRIEWGVHDLLDDGDAGLWSVPRRQELPFVQAHRSTIVLSLQEPWHLWFLPRPQCERRGTTGTLQSPGWRCPLP